MAWTSPRTWVAGETVTAAQLNAHIRDNLDFLHSKDHASVYDSANQALTDVTYENVSFNSEHFDSNTMHDNATNNSRIKCNSDGLYLAVFKVTFDTNTVGIRRVQLRENAAGASGGGTARGVWNGPSLTGENTVIAGSRLCRLVNTDYLEIFAYQDSGGSLDVVNGTASTWFQLMQLAG